MSNNPLRRTEAPELRAVSGNRLESADHRPRIVITGAASGIGRAAAEQLAGTRAQLILADNDSVVLGQLARELGAQARFCDVASETSVTIFAADILAACSSVHVLINAAGAGYVRSLGMVQVSRALMPALRAAEGARLIVNVGPAAAFTSHLFPNAASSDGFDRLSEALSLQLKGTSIAVQRVTPVFRDPAPSTKAEATRPGPFLPLHVDGTARVITEAVRQHFPAAFEGSEAQPSS